MIRAFGAAGRRHRMHIGTLIGSLGIAALASLAHAQTGCDVPRAGPDNWAVAAPESVGLSSATLCRVVTWLGQSKQSNVHAVLVVRHGKLVFEHYLAGSDEILGRAVGELAFGPQTLHDERSVTKSVVALVLGSAIDRGLIKSIDELVFSFFPEYAELRTAERDRITLRHLLTMSAGLEWHEVDTPYTSDANSENRLDNAADPYRFVLEQSVVDAPGRFRNYNSGSVDLIAAVLKKATGKPIDELARTLLFAPRGIVDMEWSRDPRGNPHAAGGLRLRPRDLAKIGPLVLQHGLWNDKQVVPASWVDAAARPQINGPGTLFYGYFFWLGRALVDKREVDWAAMAGLGGQRVFVVPTLDLVVVVNAGMYKSALQDSIPLAVLDRFVLEAAAASP